MLGTESSPSTNLCATTAPDAECASQAAAAEEDWMDTASASVAKAEPESSSAPAEETPKPATTSAGPHKLGPLDIVINWRLRAEAWDWFVPSAGDNAYGFEHSLLRVGIGQKLESFEWFLEGAQDAIVGLPKTAVQPGRLGQLGLGGTYFAANGSADTASGFLKQAFIGFDLPAHGKVKLGRFTFLDGAEAPSKDKTVATLVNTRIAQRLIGDFGFSAVQRSFDGVQLGFDEGGANFTLFGARPTQGVFQIRGMDELDINLFYGSFTVPVSTAHNAGEFRVFAIGYMDDRAGVLKTDNRSVAARTADHGQIRIGTYGMDYVHVLRTDRAGQFDFLAWGVFQNGSWGSEIQRAGAFVGEAGWQPPVHFLNPWFSAGYSYGSGDNNPNDNVHGTFFQLSSLFITSLTAWRCEANSTPFVLLARKTFGTRAAAHSSPRRSGTPAEPAAARAAWRTSGTRAWTFRCATASASPLIMATPGAKASSPVFIPAARTGNLDTSR